MKLYLSHSSGYDYKTNLYEPLKQSIATEHEVFFPHDQHEDGVKSNEIIPTCDAVLAEVSYQSTGQGIELGWADANNITIICFYRAGSQISSALRFVSDRLVEYCLREDMIEKIRSEIEKLDQQKSS